jgi:hypothetical protein
LNVTRRTRTRPNENAGLIANSNIGRATVRRLRAGFPLGAFVEFQRGSSHERTRYKATVPTLGECGLIRRAALNSRPTSTATPEETVLR